MKISRILVLTALAGFGMGGGMASGASDIARVKTILHEDGTRTVSTQDYNARELEELTYNARRVIVQRKRFLLDDQSRAIQGVVFDGNGDLVARVEFGFDSLGRMTEERTFNARGQVVRRLIYRYNVMGIQSKPVAYSFDTSGEGRPPVRLEGDAVKPTIVTPDVNGIREVEGNRYFDGMIEADSVDMRPTLPAPKIRRTMKR